MTLTEDPPDIIEVNHDLSKAKNDTSSEKSAPSNSGSGPKSAKISNALIYMIVKDDLPLSATDKPGLQKLLQVVCPYYEIPRRNKITTLIKHKAEALKLLFQGKLSEIECFSLNADVWTDTHNSRSFLGCTAHYHFEGKLSAAVLGVKELQERHTAENIVKALKSMLEVWKIDIKKVIAVVTDNGSNMVKAVNDLFGSAKSVICFAHSLNLVMQELIDKSQEITEIVNKIKKIVTFFKSPTAAAELKKIQTDAEQTLRLIQDVPTRWNSTFYMLDRFLHIIDYLVPLLIKLDHAPPCLTGQEILSLVELVNILRPAEIVTKNLGESLESHSLISVAGILDPRYKNSIFPNDDAAYQARKKVIDLIQKRTPIHQENTPTNPLKPTEKKNPLSYGSQELKNYYQQHIVSKSKNRTTSTTNLDELEFKNLSTVLLKKMKT
ncbi:zinc finger BED domain-containing protein 4-like [Cotesia glomerata]|uniref:zinc finger BED domain-containing protein 4-like n=1 Tax=Cotesia glomerata TaxID=32391 RepID=UPI001D01F22A|nr:zinc finger BED domain-containing protein 4-like [Cotesia glomerata]